MKIYIFDIKSFRYQFIDDIFRPIYFCHINDNSLIVIKNQKVPIVIWIQLIDRNFVSSLVNTWSRRRRSTRRVAAPRTGTVIVVRTRTAVVGSFSDSSQLGDPISHHPSSSRQPQLLRIGRSRSTSAIARHYHVDGSERFQLDVAVLVVLPMVQMVVGPDGRVVYEHRPGSQGLHHRFGEGSRRQLVHVDVLLDVDDDLVVLGARRARGRLHLHLRFGHMVVVVLVMVLGGQIAALAGVSQLGGFVIPCIDDDRGWRSHRRHRRLWRAECNRSGKSISRFCAALATHTLRLIHLYT